ncbi:TRIO and F-actin-binding protein-like [Haliotis rufescens]|uniref:TRIO and F-actin-binding protein-like n=1 Tax=Haliotis rufescens TaxID=6454 RepID=UPI00201EA37D|nr:TRIO and F-actin-binding protein-like [Haliotis rufescens]
MEQTEGNTFSVVFSESPPTASKNIKHELYNLTIDKDALRLWDLTSKDLILEWPYLCVRRYGRTQNLFTVEAGRRCKTGKGVFVMETTEGQAVMDQIVERTKQISGKRDKTKTTPQIEKVCTSEREVSEVKSKVCDPDGKTTTPCLETADGLAVAHIGSGSGPRAFTGSELRTPAGEESRATSGEEPRATNGSEPRATCGSEPRATSGSEPRATSESEPRATCGSEPRATSGEEPRATSGSEPRATSGSEPRATCGSEPRATSGEEPRATSGSEPRATSGEEPRATCGSEPRASSGSEPWASSGSETGQNLDNEEGAVLSGSGTRDDIEEGENGKSTSLEPIESTEAPRSQADTTPVPGEIIVFDLPKNRRSKQSRPNYENVKFMPKYNVNTCLE